jgi:hypothetical protein
MKLSGTAALINRQPVRRVGLAAVALLAALTLLGGFGIFAQSGATNLPVDPPNGGDDWLPDLPGMVDTYPPVVAYVDGNAIAGKTLAFRVYALEQSQAPNVDKSHPVRDALHGAIQDQILIDHASDYGVTVSYDDARAFAQQEKALLLGNEAARADITTQAKQMGASVDDYFDLPSVIQGYRLGMILGEMRQYILQRAPITPDRNSPSGEQAALDAFTDGIHANVRIVIDVP